MKNTLTIPLNGSAALPGWFKAPFLLLDPVGNRVFLILFCGVFSFLFMYIFSPFNMNQWYEGGPQSVAGVFCAFSLSGIIGMSVSQFGLIRLKGKKPLTHLQFLGWFIGEVMLVALIVNVVNVSMHDYLEYSWLEYTDTLKYGFGVMALPYSMALLWFQSRAAAGRLKNLAQAPAAAPIAAPEELFIRDEYDKLAMTLHPSNLLLLKAEDNYVHVYYRNGNAVKKELIRSSLKKLEPQLSGHGFTRAHRSYMVNLSKVLLFKKNTKGHFLLMDGLDEVTVPVSTSYLPEFLQRFTPAC
ncbi:LytR/AlgR family response regulator transcription factor [Chitinophaga barathri]|uniref:LytTR family transcriptional regulator n=1 Tax=Chitinophaga barathri TaxID=1647451 RepID=A0A3N4MDU2_9BACT|nr:LytTR family DNA-binding domain-containing protein [Chitinophaga barathri]RPD42054.1 LytTR family transcriptional regulator [Chitinophaga barathri]